MCWGKKLYGLQSKCHSEYLFQSLKTSADLQKKKGFIFAGDYQLSYKIEDLFFFFY